MPAKTFEVVWLLAAFCFLFSCTYNTNKAAGPGLDAMRTEKSESGALRVVNTVALEGIPSASGMVVYGGVIYIVSDDSPWLYRLDQAYRPLPPVQLFSTSYFGSGRIPKHLKADLESLALLTINNQPHLLALGSGSAAAREMGYLINIQQKQPQVTPISLRGLYAAVGKKTGAAPGLELNIEGVTATADSVYLLQRGVVNQPNKLLALPLPEFVDVLNGKAATGLPMRVTELPMPAIKGITGGFSGLTFFDEKLFVTASVENTDNAILDGEVLGSFAGYFKPGLNKILLLPIATAGREILPVKVESIAVLQKTNSHYKALVVTDNDLGQSDLLELEISINNELKK